MPRNPLNEPLAWRLASFCRLVISMGAVRAADSDRRLFQRLNQGADSVLQASEARAKHHRRFERPLRHGQPVRPAVLISRDALAGPQQIEHLLDRLDANSDGRVCVGELPEQARERLGRLVRRADRGNAPLNPKASPQKGTRSHKRPSPHQVILIKLANLL